MTKASDHESTELARRLISAADGILNPAAVGLERDLRSAAALIEEIDNPLPVIPRLMSDLAKIANTTTDVDTQRRLRRLLGEVP